MTSPARRQYLDIKAQHQDALLAYQVGEFHEFFDSDARIAAAELQIVLTARSYGPGEVVPLAGVPSHALETYLARLVARGYKVAVCDQISPPGKGLVQRAVTRILTPGTVVEPNMVPARRDNYLVALAFGARGGAGLAVVEASTGAFACVEWEAARASAALRAELERLAPAEILLADRAADHVQSPEMSEWLAGWTLTPCSDAWFEEDSARRRVSHHFGVASLVAYGCERLPLAIVAAGAILAYLERMNPTLLPLLTNLTTYDTAGFVEIDGRTWRALEVIEPTRATYGASGSRQAPTTLLATLDATRTAMGARLLRRSLLQPLRDRAALEERLDAVAELHAHTALRQRLASALDGLGDLERLIARIVHGSAAPREVFGLEQALARVPIIAGGLHEASATALILLRDSLDACPRARELIVRALAEPGAGTGRLIRAGFNAELDTLAQTAAEARQWIAMLEADERERTGIRSLKVGFNKVFGYYIEVTTPNLSRVPPDYQRRQTISTGERYVTPELKAHEAKALHASEQIEALERALYADVLRALADSAAPMRRTAQALAQVDVWLALAEVALARNYVRPELSNDACLEIVAGRHPVVEAATASGEFIANDTRLSAHDDAAPGDDARNGAPAIMLLTGPNMAGKSTYLRQVALITLLAQIGSFVPADQARIGLVDRIFTRVGAEDDLARGLSTFMLEMVETAYILRHATTRSLVILDEVGRGTSTADGLAIARAVVEYLHDHVGARTLFATHYHELADLAEALPQIGVFRMAVAERDDGAIFLHRVAPGASTESYGVLVARMAGLPASVTERAATILQWQAQTQAQRWVAESPATYESGAAASTVSGAESLALQRDLALDLAAANIAAMTPMEAINALFALQQRALMALRGSGEGM